MQKLCLSLLACIALGSNASGDIIAQWTFNSNPPDGSSNTGTDAPSTGSGTISVTGTTLMGVSATQAYSSGNGSSDPAASDDSAYHTRNYPAQGEGNKTSGIQVNISTVGYESIIVSWDQQNSASASKYLRFQYSLDGSTFADYDVFAMPAPTTWNNSRTVNLTPILGANENPNFAFRLVSEFESTATGSGAAAYIATGTASYSQSGTMRFDMLTISGTIPDGNALPTITSISNQTILVDTPTDPMPFQVGDAETPADELTLAGVSSNPAVVPDAGIVFDGFGTERTVVVGPNFDAIGSSKITIYVIDGGGKSNFTSFIVTVLPANTPPSLSAFTNVHAVVNTSFNPVDFTVLDNEQEAGSLTVSATSSNQNVIPDINLVLSGTGGNRTLNMSPAAGQIGNAIITVTVNDGALAASRRFNAMVLPSSNIVLREPFDYGDGPLTTNSAGLWTTRAGTPGQIQLASGTAVITGNQSEDIVARLIGAPYETSSSTVLYASFDVTFSALPGLAPDIFAHFSGTDANDLFARVLSSTTNAGPGYFRLGVANTVSTTTNVVDYPLDLSLGTTYQVVVAYDVAIGGSKLWVNPASGGGPVEAIDPREPSAINAFGFRQSSRIGDMRIDNLLVGLSFEDVTPNLTRVRIRRNGNAVEVYWPSAKTSEGYQLESASSLADPVWEQVTEPSVPMNDWDVVTVPDPATERYFRLVKP